MSIRVMSLVWSAHFHDITFVRVAKKKVTGERYEKIVKVLNSNVKNVCLALADHANDEGEGAYPSIDTIADKTELSEVTVIACLKAMKQEGIITYTGRSKWTTCNYTVSKSKLTEMAGWERQKREKVGSKAASTSEESKAALVSKVKPLQSESKAALHKPSFHPETTPIDITPDPVFAALETLSGGLNSNTTRFVDTWREKHTDEWILKAVEMSKGKSIKYADSILIGWEAEGYPKTREERIQERKAKKESVNLDDLFAKARAEAMAEVVNE